MRKSTVSFHERAEAAWQEYLRTGISHPVDKVFERVQARIDAKRRELLMRLQAAESEEGRGTMPRR